MSLLKFNFKPLTLMFKVITFIGAFVALSVASVSLAVALPWALLVAACITFSFGE